MLARSFVPMTQHTAPEPAPAVARRPAGPAATLGAAPPSLATRMAPPLLLPGEHFATALVFLLAGVLGVVWAAPDIARGSFAMPRVVATTHLFTLGWITTTIQGALYQFLPVALQTPIRSQRVAHAGLLLYAPGLVLFVSGLMLGRLPLMLSGAALFGTALLLFVGNLAATLHAARERNLSWWALTGAAVALASTVILGVSLAGNLRWGYLGPKRFLAVSVHLHVAIFGWVLLTIVGVAHRLLPMFLLSHGATERPGGSRRGCWRVGWPCCWLRITRSLPGCCGPSPPCWEEASSHSSPRRRCSSATVADRCWIQECGWRLRG